MRTAFGGGGQGAQGRDGVPARQSPARLPGLRRGRRVPAAGPGVRVRRTTSRAWTTPSARSSPRTSGPIVKKEANRCIVCMRCVRYCDEVMGEDALTAHQRGVRTEISSFNRQPLDVRAVRQLHRGVPGRRADRAAVPLQGAPVGPAPAHHDLPVLLERLLGAPGRARHGDPARARHRVPRRQPGVPVRARPLRLRVRERATTA